MRKLIVAVILILLVGGAYVKRGEIKNWVVEWQKPDVPAVAYQEGDEESEESVDDTLTGNVEESTDDQAAADVTTDEDADEPDDTETTDAALPAEYNLAVPFTSQAPKSIWDEVHEETCEEASSLMAAYYFQGLPAGKVDSDQAEADLLKMVDFENSFFGFYKDTTTEQTATLIETYFQLSTEVLVNPTVMQIKQALVDGHPVIVPAAGRQLGNPNFTGEGPLYHMLLIKGYTADGFITNDPGTRLGADYFYTFDVIMNAMHDWNDGDVANGQKIVIVVTP